MFVDFFSSSLVKCYCGCWCKCGQRKKSECTSLQEHTNASLWEIQLSKLQYLHCEAKWWCCLVLLLFLLLPLQYLPPGNLYRRYCATESIVVWETSKPNAKFLVLLPFLQEWIDEWRSKTVSEEWVFLWPRSCVYICTVALCHYMHMLMLDRLAYKLRCTPTRPNTTTTTTMMMLANKMPWREFGTT